MPVFTYIASGEGGEVRGTLVADTARAARDGLRAEGLRIRHVEPHKAVRVAVKLPRLPGPAVWSGVSSNQVNGFYRELSTLLATGIPLLEALQTVGRQHTGRFRASVQRLSDRVSAGVSLAEAMGEQERLFDPMARSIVEVGERAGTLDDSLTRLAAYKEQAQKLKGKIGTALLYPVIVLVMGLGVGVFLMTFVVPNLLTVITESGRQLPASTRLVKAISDGLLGYWWLLAAGVAVAVMVIAQLLRSASVRMLQDRLQLKTPLLGDLVRKQAVARVALVIATLVRSDVPFVRALELARRGVRNLVIRGALDDAEKAIYAGRDIAEALEGPQGSDGSKRKRVVAIPPLVVQVFAVGQASGRLEEMLERLAIDYDQQVSVSAQRLTAFLEPLIIMVLAVVVGFVAFATIMPILEVGDVL